MGLDKGEEPFVLLCLSQELEGDSSYTDRANHRRNFYRSFPFGKRDFKIENVVEPDMGLALDNAPTQRDVENRSFPAHHSPGKREAEPNWNTEMFTAFERLTTIRPTNTAIQKPMAAVLALKWYYPNHGYNQLTRRSRPHLCDRVFLTPRATRLTTHVPVPQPA